MAEKYYIPSVTDGVLSWTPTDDSMPTVPSVKIKGDRGVRGIQGRSGVIVDSLGNVDMTGYATEEYVNSVAMGEGIDLSDYATIEYVNGEIAKINFNGTGGEVDLSNYYTKAEIDKLIPDLSNFVTKDYVDNAVDNVDVDLTNYYTKEETEAKIAQAQLGGEGNVDLSAFALKSEIPDVSDFISEIPDEYLTDSEAEAKYAKITDIPVIPDMSEFITEIPSEYITETELNAKGYATESFVTQKISESGTGSANVDLTNYYTKSETYSKAEIDAKGYQTEAQVLALIQANLPEDGDEVSY